MEEKKEMVNSPSHYNQGDIECIDAMIAAKGIEAVMHWCDCNVFKYEWRLGYKDEEEQEIGKMKWYLDKYIELKKKGLTERQIKNILNK